MATDSYEIRVAGTSFRQDVVKTLKEGEQCFLVPDPTNEYDPKAIKVTTKGGQFFGFVPKGTDLADAIAGGLSVYATIASIALASGTNLHGVHINVAIALPESFNDDLEDI